MSAQVVLIIRIAVIVFIYLFLALVIRILWKYTFTPRQQNTSTPEISLIEINNDQLRQFSLPEIYIGRDKNAGFSIMDDAASNLHARIFLKDTRWWIEDLNSTNGTFLNEEMIVSPNQLFPEDVIRCGKTEFKVIFKTPPEKNILD